MQLVDLRRQYQTIRKDVQKAIAAVLLRTDFIMGKDLQKFEEAFAKFCNVKYAVGVDSGTGALELAMHALKIRSGDVPKGTIPFLNECSPRSDTLKGTVSRAKWDKNDKERDEVIVPVFTFYATGSAVVTVGAKPVFVDVEDETGNMDPQKLEQVITTKTRAIMPVHLFGQPANMEAIKKIAHAHNLYLIEDAAQAHGAKVQMAKGEWRMAGSVGEMGCFSFYPAKNLGAYGDGGMVVTNQNTYAERIKLLRDYGRTGKYEHELIGYNRRLDTLQAAILLVKLKKLNLWNRLRRSKANLYERLLKEIGIQTFKVRPFSEPVYHVYAIRVSQRDELAAFLKKKGVATGVHYPIPLHLQKAFQFLGYRKGDFPVAEKIAGEILSLPMFPELKDSEIKKIVGLIKQFYL